MVSCKYAECNGEVLAGNTSKVVVSGGALGTLSLGWDKDEVAWRVMLGSSIAGCVSEPWHLLQGGRSNSAVCWRDVLVHSDLFLRAVSNWKMLFQACAVSFSSCLLENE